MGVKMKGRPGARRGEVWAVLLRVSLLETVSSSHVCAGQTKNTSFLAVSTLLLRKKFFCGHKWRLRQVEGDQPACVVPQAVQLRL